jgi:hypothetical protein
MDLIVFSLALARRYAIPGNGNDCAIGSQAARAGEYRQHFQYAKQPNVSF